MPRFALLPILLLNAFSACSQPTVCLPTKQAARIADSLAVLPLVRREAAAWSRAAGGYRAAADSLRVANAGYRAAYQSEQLATAQLGALLANAQATATGWKATARKRGLLNLLFIAGLGGLGYFTLTH